MSIVRFTGVIKIRNSNPFLLVSAPQARAIKPGWRRPLPVLVRVNGKPSKAWRINMMPAGNGTFYLYLHGEVRRASGTKVGDRVRAEVEFDAAYRNGPAHPMPGWFRKSLLADSRATQNWQALIPSRKKEVLRYFSRLKSVEARERNLHRVMEVLSGKPGRFMARAWKNGA
jgi:hypothetical protein